MTDLIPSLHAGTPDVAVKAGSGGVTLRFLRSLDSPTMPPRILVSRTVADLPARTLRLYGARKLKDENHQSMPDATTVTTLSGQAVMQHTADSGCVFSLSDAAGRPLWRQNAQGTINTFTHESEETAGRLLAIDETPTDGISRVRERLVYGKADEPEIKSRNLLGAVTRHYDNAGYTDLRSISLTGRLLDVQQCLLATEVPLVDWAREGLPPMEAPLRVSATFDAAGAPLTETNAAEITLLTAYDISGTVRETRLRYAVKPGQPETEVVTLYNVVRRADGAVLAQTTGSGIEETYEYNPCTRFLTRHTTARPARHPCGALLIADLHYAYDAAGNILRLEDKGAHPVWHHNHQATGLRDYTYDTLYRLTSATGRERVCASRRRGPLPASLVDTTAGNRWAAYRECYRYDDGDNLTHLRHQGGSGDRSQKLRVAAGSNRAVAEEGGITPEAGFLAGGLQKQLSDGRALHWLADGQPGYVTPVTRQNAEDDRETYHYANGGTRVKKIRRSKVGTGAQVQVTACAGGCETRKTTLYTGDTPRLQLHVTITQAGSARLVANKLTDEVHLRFSFGDHLSSVGGETNAEGDVTSWEVFLPYGGSAGSDEETVEALDRTRRYAGKARDATGLLYYGWRYYQPEMGRWLSADPGGLIDGVNLFRFCKNSPVMLRDNNGQSPERGNYFIEVGLLKKSIYRTWLRASPPAIAVFDPASHSYIKSADFTVIDPNEHQGNHELILSTLDYYKKTYKKLSSWYSAPVENAEDEIRDFDLMTSRARVNEGTDHLLMDIDKARKQAVIKLERLREQQDNISLGFNMASVAAEIINGKKKLSSNAMLKLYVAAKKSEIDNLSPKNSYGVLLATVQSTREDTDNVEINFEYAVANPLTQLIKEDVDEGGILSHYQKEYPERDKYRVKGIGKFLVFSALKDIDNNYNIVRVGTNAVNVRSAAIANWFGAKLQKWPATGAVSH